MSDLCYPCSDDELYTSAGLDPPKSSQGDTYNETSNHYEFECTWKPTQTQLEKVFTKMLTDPDGICRLSWQNPGRRPPTPPNVNVMPQQQQFGVDEHQQDRKSYKEDLKDLNKNVAENQTSTKASLLDDFEMDEEMTSNSNVEVTSLHGRNHRGPLLHAPRERELKGSARKTTTSFDSIMNKVNKQYNSGMQ